MKLGHRTRDHYAAIGKNASYCIHQRHDESASELAIRRGRVEEGEAIQIAFSHHTFHKTRTITCYGHISLDQATWDALIEFVRENREIPEFTSKERMSTKP